MSTLKCTRLELCPIKTFKFFLYVIMFLLTANVFGIISNHFWGHGHLYGLVPLFNFDTEANIPTLYSFTTILFAALLLFFIGLEEKKAKRKWLTWIGLGIIFLFLAIDEGSAFHEKFIEGLRTHLHTDGAFYFAWVIPYGLFCLILLASTSKFLFALRTKTRNLFLFSGTIFVMGAIGFEMISGVFAARGQTETLLYHTLTTFEETFEMLGIGIFNYALLDQIVTSHQSVSLTLLPDVEATQPEEVHIQV